MPRGVYPRWNTKHTTAEFQSITIADLKKLNKDLSPDWLSLRQNNDGSLTDRFSFGVPKNHIYLTYSYIDKQGMLRNSTRSVKLTWSVPFLGGKRVWFICPCGRRVGRLFIYQEHVGCRNCFNLAYPSQNNDTQGIIEEKIYRLENKAVHKYSRPKGIHKRAYQRLQDEIVGLRMKRDDVISIKREKFLAGVTHMLPKY